MKHGKAFVAVALAFALLAAPMFSGCYGSFALTSAVYKFNGVTGSKAIETAVFWLFLILPVYNFAMVGDVVVLNVIEFWTGANFAGRSRAEATGADGSHVAFASAPDGRTARLVVCRGGKVQGELAFFRTSDSTIEVRDARGRLAGTVERMPDGGLRLTDAAGRCVSSVSSDELLALAR